MFYIIDKVSIGSIQLSEVMFHINKCKIHVTYLKLYCV